MIEFYETKCCGMDEINNLSHAKTPAEAIFAIQNKYRAVPDRSRWDKCKPVLMFFTGVTKRLCGDHASSRLDDYGQALHDYIVSNQLGEVTKSKNVQNPRTDNDIAAWVWTPNWPAVMNHATGITPPAPLPGIAASDAH